ncbi:hypothetical protein E4U54_005196, partial [Claviceps lovelessii]
MHRAPRVNHAKEMDQLSATVPTEEHLDLVLRTFVRGNSSPDVRGNRTGPRPGSLHGVDSPPPEEEHGEVHGQESDVGMDAHEATPSAVPPPSCAFSRRRAPARRWGTSSHPWDWTSTWPDARYNSNAG